MIPRTLAHKLRQAAAQYPVVTVTGPRQSGKTTLVRHVFGDHAYVSLEDPDERRFALEDPRGFLERFPDGVVLDEAQRVPDLFSYIQTRVDATDRPGLYVLSGSQNFLLLRSISQSLAGRCAVLHLLPFSQDELRGEPPLAISEIGQSLPGGRPPPATDLFTTLFTGGYPRIHDQGLDPQEWLRNYLQTYLERDVRELVNVGDLAVFHQFLSLCAGRAGQLLNRSALAADCGVSHTTVQRWLSVLEASFIVLLLRPHHRNFNKRLVKSPKLYFLDSGLLCYLMQVRDPEQLRVHAARGAIFESFVVAELHKRAVHAGQEPRFYFWRDAGGHEIDLLIDHGDRQIPVEIKSGQTVATDFFRGLDHWRGLAGDPEGPAALVYAGDNGYRRRGVVVYPWWSF